MSKSYVHIQDAPSDLWIVTHNRNSCYPVVDASVNYNGINQKVLPASVKSLDENTLEVRFNSPRTGVVRVYTNMDQQFSCHDNYPAVNVGLYPNNTCIITGTTIPFTTDSSGTLSDAIHISPQTGRVYKLHRSGTGYSVFVSLSDTSVVSEFTPNIPFTGTPYGVTVWDDWMYVCTNAGKLYKINMLSQVVHSVVDIVGDLRGITTDGESLYIGEYTSHSVIKVDMNLVEITRMSVPCAVVSGVAYDHDMGYLYASCHTHTYVYDGFSSTLLQTFPRIYGTQDIVVYGGILFETESGVIRASLKAFGNPRCQ